METMSKFELTKEEMNDYAWKRVYWEGRDSEIIKEFIEVIGRPEAEVWNIPVGDEKLS